MFLAYALADLPRDGIEKGSTMRESRSATASSTTLRGVDSAQPSAGSASLPSGATAYAGKRTGRTASLRPSNEEHRLACRWFPGFELLPTAVLDSLAGYAPLFVCGSGPLSLRERAVIALAVAGREDAGFGAPAQSQASIDAPRDHLIGQFATRVIGPSPGVSDADVAQLLDAGFSFHAIRSIAETAVVVRFLAALAAAMRLRPMPLSGRSTIVAVSSSAPCRQPLQGRLA